MSKITKINILKYFYFNFKKFIIKILKILKELGKNFKIY